MSFQRMLPTALAPNLNKVNIERSSSGVKPQGVDPLRQACEDFESVFVAYLLKSMRKTVPKSELMNGGLSEDTYMSMMDDEIASAVAKGPGIGLAAAIYRQLNEAKKI